MKGHLPLVTPCAMILKSRVRRRPLLPRAFFARYRIVIVSHLYRSIAEFADATAVSSAFPLSAFQFHLIQFRRILL